MQHLFKLKKKNKELKNIGSKTLVGEKCLNTVHCTMDLGACALFFDRFLRPIQGICVICVLDAHD